MQAPAFAPDAAPAVRNLLQARILSRLFADQVGATARLALKGGMALRVAHGSERQTKDIDLDADASLPLARAQKVVRRAVREATAGGWLTDVVVSEPKQTGTTARWKIRGLLPDSGAALHLTVELSFRHAIQAHEVRLVDWHPDGVAATRIPVYQDSVLVLSKIHALMSPNRDAPRDVVDLYLLFQAGADILLGDLALQIPPPPRDAVIQTLWDKMEGMDDGRFRTEVLPNWTLPEATGAVPVPDWASMRLLVAERVEAALRAAPEVARPPGGARRVGP